MMHSPADTQSTPRLRRFLLGTGKALLSMALGAVAVLVIGQVYAQVVGGGCSILCDPQIAATTGAASGLLSYGFQRSA